MKKWITACFLLTELILYVLILTTGGTLLVCCEYSAIVLCFVYALFMGAKKNILLTAGLARTVGADFFLVVFTPIQQLWGMLFFMMAQMLYAVKLQLSGRNTFVMIARIIAMVTAVGTAFAVLRDRTDALALVSICYYANLIINIAASFVQTERNLLLPAAFILFLLCDTFIGLQAAGGAYLPIEEGTVLHDVVYMDFNIAWFFYLPSQVMLALISAGSKLPEKK